LEISEDHKKMLHVKNDLSEAIQADLDQAEKIKTHKQ
jgi:hypothetical protein